MNLKLNIDTGVITLSEEVVTKQKTFEVPKRCPYAQDGSVCGSWCALFVIYTFKATSTVTLKCHDVNYTFDANNVIDY